MSKFERPSGRYRGTLLTEAESHAVIEEINRWCRRTGTNYNKLVVAANVGPSVRSDVCLRKRRLTLTVAQRVRSVIVRYPQGISKAEHKSRLRTLYQPLPSEEIEQRRVDRTPCSRCGVRADVGCKHSIWSANHYGIR